MFKELKPAFLMMLVMTVLTGLLYPAAITGIAQVAFKDQANGSLITVNGQVVGSRLIGQNFSRPEYFHPRPSAAGDKGYDPTATGGSNLGPTSEKLLTAVKARVAGYRKENALDAQILIPADAVTASASGIDPHISPRNAELQTARVAKARSVTADQVHAVIAEHTEGRTWGLLGEPRVNVLELNLAMDRRFPKNGSGSTSVQAVR